MDAKRSSSYRAFYEKYLIHTQRQSMKAVTILESGILKNWNCPYARGKVVVENPEFSNVAALVRGGLPSRSRGEVVYNHRHHPSFLLISSFAPSNNPRDVLTYYNRFGSSWRESQPKSSSIKVSTRACWNLMSKQSNTGSIVLPPPFKLRFVHSFFPFHVIVC